MQRCPFLLLSSPPHAPLPPVIISVHLCQEQQMLAPPCTLTVLQSSITLNHDSLAAWHGGAGVLYYTFITSKNITCSS